MSLMSWKEAYDVNIAQIDQQHKKLVDLINALNEAMAKGRAKEVLNKILNELVAYCASHFKLEEQMMQVNGYPEYDEHKDKHDKMTAKVLSLKKEVAAGKKLISLDVMKFLEQWLDKHILGTDQKYAPFLKSKGIC